MVPWAVNSDLLWSVDHLVKRIDFGSSDKWQDKRFTFDYKQAERESAFGRYKQMEQAEPEYEEYGPSPLAPDPLEDAGDWTQVLSPGMILAGLRRSRRGRVPREAGSRARGPRRAAVCGRDVERWVLLDGYALYTSGTRSQGRWAGRRKP